MIQSRGQFGFYGAVLVFAASIVLDFGFLAAQLVIQADAMNLLVGSVSVPVWIAILAVPVLVLTIYGYDWIHRWQRWMTGPARGHVRRDVHSGARRRTAREGAGRGPGAPTFALFMGATGLFVIAMVSWAPYVSDYSRYLPPTVSRPRTFWAVVLGSAIPAIFCGILGAYLTGLMPDAPSTVAAVREVCRASWVAADHGDQPHRLRRRQRYTGMLALVEHRQLLPRRAPARCWCAWSARCSSIAAAPCLRPARLPPVRRQPRQLPQRAAVRLHPVERDQPDRLLPGPARRVRRPVVLHPARPCTAAYRWRGLIAYLIAIAIEVPFIDQTFYTGPLVEPLGGVDISWVVGGVAGAVVFYLVALRVPPISGPANGLPDGLSGGPQGTLSGSMVAQRVTQRGARADAELGEDPVQVGTDGAGRQVQAVADLPVAQTGRRELRDLQLLRGQRLPPSPFPVAA